MLGLAIAAGLLAVVDWGACRKESPEARTTRGPRLSVTSIEDLVALPDEEFDFASAALLLAKEVDASIDVRNYEILLDTLADDIRKPISEAHGVHAIASVLVEELFAKRGFDFSYEPTKENHFLPGILDTKTGDCVGWMTLYLSLAERLDLSMNAVVIPNHCFVRLTFGEESLNLDAWDHKPDEFYLAHHPVPPDKAKGFYLRAYPRNSPDA